MTTIVNTEMAAMWDGDEGDDWTENADRYDATDRYLAPVWDAEVTIAPTERVVDIGCGTGRPTRDAARKASAGSVLGVDLSTRMLEEARRRSRLEGVTNVEYLRADAQAHPFDPGAHDLAISLFGGMFFNDTTAAFANIGRGLRPGGRLAMLSWQPFEKNEWLTLIWDTLAAGREIPSPPSGVPGPFGLADPDDVTKSLEDAGFVDVVMMPVLVPMWLGTDADDAWDFLSDFGPVRGLSEGLDDTTRADVLARLRRAVAEHETDDGVAIGSASWLTTARWP
jgi:SAM-dependent methyltransferase